jgi:hypothetical protein
MVSAQLIATLDKLPPISKPKSFTTPNTSLPNTRHLNQQKPHLKNIAKLAA